MKRLLGLLMMMGVVGCGGEDTSPKKPSVNDGGARAQTDNADSITALENLGARIERNSEGEVVKIDLMSHEIVDSDLVHLKRLASLQSLDLSIDGMRGGRGSRSKRVPVDRSQLTDAGLVHLKG